MTPAPVIFGEEDLAHLCGCTGGRNRQRERGARADYLLEEPDESNSTTSKSRSEVSLHRPPTMSSTLYWSGADRYPRASAVLARCRNEAIVAVQRTYLGEDRNGRRAVLSAAAARRQRGQSAVVSI